MLAKPFHRLRRSGVRPHPGSVLAPDGRASTKCRYPPPPAPVARLVRTVKPPRPQPGATRAFASVPAPLGGERWGSAEREAEGPEEARSLPRHPPQRPPAAGGGSGRRDGQRRQPDGAGRGEQPGAAGAGEHPGSPRPRTRIPARRPPGSRPCRGRLGAGAGPGPGGTAAPPRHPHRGAPWRPRLPRPGSAQSRSAP